MNRGNVTNRIVIFLFVLINLCSCMDDELISSTNQLEDNLFALNIPEMNAVNIKTRSDDMKSIEDVLAVVIRGGVAISESPDKSTFVSSEGKVLVKLETLNVQPNETLHIFCNVGTQSLTGVTTDDELLKQVTCTSGKDVMYGVRMPGASNSLDLRHSMSNVEVFIKKEYSIDSLLVCNVPRVGYADGSGYITPAIEDVPFKLSKFFVSRSDNTTSEVTTFLLAYLRYKGWYRLDFYNGEKNLSGNMNYKDSLLNIESNSFYHFSIDSVSNNGYKTKEEACKNPGSNIIYSLSVDKNISLSNGQYALATSVNEIMLYPNKPGGSIDISAVLPNGPVSDVTTYLVKMYSKYNHVTMMWDAQQSDSINLKKNEVLTTGNSNRKILFSCTGAWVEDDFLEIRLGNITKIIRFKMLTANSYLMDCRDGQEIKIPYLQANLEMSPREKTRRIEKGDVDKVEIIWADQPDCDLVLTPKEDSGWFTVKSAGSTFVGNVVVGAKDKDGKVLWSWHIWCMANDKNPIVFKSDKGIYDYKEAFEQKYSGFVWMDRNLGAYDLRIGKASSRGLGYCHGRKDPFTLGPDILPPSESTFPEDTLYVGNREFKMTQIYPGPGGVFCYKAFPAQIDDPEGINDQEMFEYTVRYPYSMPYIESHKTNWRLRHGNYWLTKNGGKSGYDPCPIGWRLPYVTDPIGPWYPFNFENKVKNPLDENEDYGMSWKSDTGELTYYPYAPSRASVFADGMGNLITYTYLSAPKRIVNKGFKMVLADELDATYRLHKALGVYNQYNVNYSRQTTVIHWDTYEAHRATVTRCVRDKSINQ